MYQFFPSCCDRYQFCPYLLRAIEVFLHIAINSSSALPVALIAVLPYLLRCIVALSLSSLSLSLSLSPSLSFSFSLYGMLDSSSLPTCRDRLHSRPTWCDGQQLVQLQEAEDVAEHLLRERAGEVRSSRFDGRRGKPPQPGRYDGRDDRPRLKNVCRDDPGVGPRPSSSGFRFPPWASFRGSFRFSQRPFVRWSLVLPLRKNSGHGGIPPSGSCNELDIMLLSASKRQRLKNINCS